MPREGAGWDSAQYLRFESERTLPCRDLARRVELDAPRRVVDLGCGPGNSTAVLRDRWPRARIVGVDSSAEMLVRARESAVEAEWTLADVRTWRPRTRVDLVFSNAALQWVPDHPQAIPRIWRWVAPGGAFAFQVPARSEPTPAWVRAMATVQRRPRWHRILERRAEETPVLPPASYYDLLASAARRIDLWDTEYHHVLDGPVAVVEWIRGTALRPWLTQLTEEADRAALLAELTREIARAYPPRRDGKVVFPFLRRFVVAYR